MRKYVLLLLLCSCHEGLTQQLSDTSLLTRKAFTPKPSIALLLAVILPSSGQIYNREVWKLPVVLGTALTFSYYISYYHELYSNVRTAFRYETDNDPSTLNPFPNLAVSTLRHNLTRLRRNRDYFIILAGIAYVLQAAEAYVAAHLFGFDSNMSLSLRASPFLIQAESGPVAGASLRVSFLDR